MFTPHPTSTASYTNGNVLEAGFDKFESLNVVACNCCESKDDVYSKITVRIMIGHRKG